MTSTEVDPHNDDELDRLRRQTSALRARVAELESVADQMNPVLDAIREAVIATDSGGRVVYWNQGARALYGYTDFEAIGRTLGGLIDVDGGARVAFGASTFELTDTEHVHRRKNGTLLWVEVTESTYLGDDGEPGTVYVARDVTRRSRTETELRQVRAELERRVEARTAALAEAVEQLRLQITERERAEAATNQFFRISPALMMVTNFDGMIERVNPAFGTHLGGVPEDVKGSRLLDFVHPDDSTLVSKQLAAVARGQSVLSFEARIVGRGGRVSWVELTAAGVAARDAIFFSGIDTTPRRQTMQALRDSEQRFRELAENVSEVFWLADADMARILYASPAFEPIWGRRVIDVVQSRSVWLDAIHPEDRARANQAFLHLVQEGDMDVEYRILRPDGSERWVHDRGYPVMSEDGRVGRIAGIASDITDRKLAQQALHAVALGTASAGTGDRFFEKLMQHVATAIRADDAWLCERGEQEGDLRVLAWWAQGSVRGDKSLRADMIPCHDVLAGTPRLIAHGAGRDFPGSLLGDREAFMAIPLADTAGKVLGALAVAWAEPIEDLAMADSILQIFAARASAELERLRVEARVWAREEELAHVGRLQTMGEMASGVAHELNQPLLAIMTHAAAAKLGLSCDKLDVVGRDLSDIELQAERAAMIIQRLRSFVQRHPPAWAPIDVNALIDGVLQLVGLNARRLRGTVEAELAADFPPVLADRIQLEQVLVNLVNNALEAMQALPEHERRVVLSTEARRDDIVVAVDDLGPGPPDSIDPFEPFVSTKADGLGIGLSISRSIIERHRGHLWHEARHPRGWRFAFRLPRVAEGAA